MFICPGECNLGAEYLASILIHELAHSFCIPIGYFKIFENCPESAQTACGPEIVLASPPRFPRHP